MLKLSRFLVLALLTACQSATLNPQTLRPGTSLQAQQAQRAALEAAAADEQDGLITEARFADFDQGVVKDNISILTQGIMVPRSAGAPGRFISRPRPAPFAFNAVTPGWESSGPLELQMRVSSDGKNWGGWLPLLRERSLLLPTTSNWVQYQVIFSSGPQGAEAPRFQGITLQFGTQAPTFPSRPGIQHNIPKPAMVSRAAWGARPPKAAYTPHQPAGIVLHHTWKPSQAQYNKDASMRGIQNYHMNDNKWSDIGYHFLIGPEGVIYQGRPENVVGAHSTPNTNMVGVCVFGDYDAGKDTLTPESREAVLKVLTWLSAEYNISPNAFYGHRDFSPKTCPGDNIYNFMDSFKQEVTRRLQAGGVLVNR
ncbi:MAG: peptidoglycan recognition family protein [Candidatus Sericytochromatia bacterium]